MESWSKLRTRPKNSQASWDLELGNHKVLRLLSVGFWGGHYDLAVHQLQVFLLAARLCMHNLHMAIMATLRVDLPAMLNTNFLLFTQD